MTAPRLSQLPAAAQANVRRLAAEQGHTLSVPVSAPKPGKRVVNPAHWQGAEEGRGGLREAVIRMLRNRGYWPRDKKHILSGVRPERGWVLHYGRAFGNPHLLDILLLGLSLIHI